MSLALVVAVGLIAATGYVLARRRALARSGGDARGLHSLPRYYGSAAALFASIPALGVLIIWLLGQPALIQNAVLPIIPAEEITSAGVQSLILSDVSRVASGLDVATDQGVLTTASIAAMADDPSDLRDTLGSVGVALGSDVKPFVLKAAQATRALTGQGRFWMVLVVLGLAAVGAVIGIRLADPNYRARNVVERSVLALLVGAACLAILTTLGLSLIHI